VIVDSDRVAAGGTSGVAISVTVAPVGLAAG